MRAHLYCAVRRRAWAAVFVAVLAYVICVDAVPSDTPSQRFQTTWRVTWPSYSPTTTTTTTGTSPHRATGAQLFFTVDTQRLLAEGKCNADCSNIQFQLGAVGGQSLYYFFEHGFNTAHTKTWVRVPELQEGTTLDLVGVYGTGTYRTASGYMDGDMVFDFFDDFTGDAVDEEKWTLLGGEHVSITQSDAHLVVRQRGKPLPDTPFLGVVSKARLSGDYSLFVSRRVVVPNAGVTSLVVSDVPVDHLYERSTNNRYEYYLSEGDNVCVVNTFFTGCEEEGCECGLADATAPTKHTVFHHVQMDVSVSAQKMAVLYVDGTPAHDSGLHANVNTGYYLMLRQRAQQFYLRAGEVRYEHVLAAKSLATWAPYVVTPSGESVVPDAATPSHSSHTFQAVMILFAILAFVGAAMVLSGTMRYYRAQTMRGNLFNAIGARLRSSESTGFVELRDRHFDLESSPFTLADSDDEHDVVVGGAEEDEEERAARAIMERGSPPASPREGDHA